MNVVGLFAGIGGLELGFRRPEFTTSRLCEIDDVCQRVLKKRFRGIPVESDVFAMRDLEDCDVLTAGFPCQSFSQAGMTQGLDSSRPLVFALLKLVREARTLPQYLVFENVPNIVHLAGGEALRYITRIVECLGYTWAYRIVDTSSFGLPQRRARWIFVASLLGDAPRMMLEQEAALAASRIARAHGFYWTEGNRGLGWADDAVPPLKSGSTLGIPSPPAIWMIDEMSIVKPSIRDAERLQGFPPDWTSVAGMTPRDDRKRWRMVGNAVSVPTARWVADRIVAHVEPAYPEGVAFNKTDTWPRAAWGRSGKRVAVSASTHPMTPKFTPILDFLKDTPEPLSVRATRGFRTRLEASSLRYPAEFLEALRHHESAARAATL
jgi:DNA (cytosine-5)-methyltransferase 1